MVTAKLNHKRIETLKAARLAELLAMAEGEADAAWLCAEKLPEGAVFCADEARFLARCALAV